MLLYSRRQKCHNEKCYNDNNKKNQQNTKKRLSKFNKNKEHHSKWAKAAVTAIRGGP